MSSPHTPREPSMEEILASIRRIIAEEGQNPPPAQGAGGPATQPSPPAGSGRSEPGRIVPAGPAQAKAATDSVLDLTEFIEDDAPREGEALAPLSPHEPDPEPSPAAPLTADLAPPQPTLALPTPAPEEKPVLSLESEKIVADALDEVAQQVRAQKPAEPSKLGSSPLEALVLEALKPSLQSWLDQNLPALVERVLREEMRRLARRIEDA